MKIIIEGSAKEIADFVLAVQNQREEIEKKIIKDLEDTINTIL